MASLGTTPGRSRWRETYCHEEIARSISETRSLSLDRWLSCHFSENQKCLYLFVISFHSREIFGFGDSDSLIPLLLSLSFC